MIVPSRLDRPPLTNCQTWAISAVNATEVWLCEIECGGMGLCTVSGEKGTGENNCWRAHKRAVREGEMDAHCCVGGQRVQQSERMPYATLRQAKSGKKRRRSRVRQEWLVSISTDIICVWPSHFSSRSTFIPPVSLIDRGYTLLSAGKQEKGLKEAEEGDRKNEWKGIIR